MPSNHLILCHPLLLLAPIFPSIRVFSNESALHIRWPKYWSFSFNISPSNEHPGLISFRMDWLDLPAVQGTLKSLLQYHSSKASFLWPSVFFMVQLSHLYMTTGKTIALTRPTFVGKVMSLLFNMPPGLETTFPTWRCQLHYPMSGVSSAFCPSGVDTAQLQSRRQKRCRLQPHFLLIWAHLTQRESQAAGLTGVISPAKFGWVCTSWAFSASPDHYGLAQKIKLPHL